MYLFKGLSKVGTWIWTLAKKLFSMKKTHLTFKVKTLHKGMDFIYKHFKIVY